MFVEIEVPESEVQPNAGTKPPLSASTSSRSQTTGKGGLSHQDMEKFAKHFSDLFDQANLPGPDYYEFSKMMVKLETSVPDENTRMAAVYAALQMQGLEKDKIIESAKHYCTILESDKNAFEKAAADKASSDVEDRKRKIGQLENKVAQNNEMIQKLTVEIKEAQSQIASLQDDISQEDAKIAANKSGYNSAYAAMYNKITNDIQKINNVLN